MKILFDQGTPVPLRGHLSAHDVITAAEKGWSNLSNGDLLEQAESDGFEALITTDQNLKYQQNLSGRTIAILVLTRASWPRIQARISEVQDAISGLEVGNYVEVKI